MTNHGTGVNLNDASDSTKIFQKVSPPSLPTSELFINLDCLSDDAFAAAYQHCRQVTKRGSKTFYLGALFLPYEKRKAMWAVYNFCRYTDDLVDCAPHASQEELLQRLSLWEDELRSAATGVVRPDFPQMVAWYHACRRFNIPLQPPLELIEGVRMDLVKNRYKNFEELRLYCYRVASTVGLMASEIIGYNHPAALEYAVKLGIAMQLTNILRDVGEDLRMGRIYLPQDELEEYGITEEQLAQGIINDRLVRLMQFQIARARQYYQEAIPGIEYLDKDSRLSITIAAQLYSRILDRIERNNYDVFRRRAYVPLPNKLQTVSGVWLRRKFRQVSLPPSPLRHNPHHEEADA